MFDLNQYLTKTTSEVGACPCCVPLTAPALIPVFMPNVDPLGISSQNCEALTLCQRQEEFPSQPWCQSCTRIRKESWFEPFHSALTGKRGELLAPEQSRAPLLAAPSAGTSLPIWNPVQHSSHGPARSCRAADPPLPPAPACRHQALPCRKSSLQRERWDQCTRGSSPALLGDFQEFPHVHSYHTFLEEQIHVDGGQVLLIHGDPELCVLHQGTVQPELLGKEQLLQAGPHVP